MRGGDVSQLLGTLWQKRVQLGAPTGCARALVLSHGLTGPNSFPSGLRSAATAGPITAVPRGDPAIYSLERMSSASETRDSVWGWKQYECIMWPPRQPKGD